MTLGCLHVQLAAGSTSFMASITFRTDHGPTIPCCRACAGVRCGSAQCSHGGGPAAVPRSTALRALGQDLLNHGAESPPAPGSINNPRR